MAVGAHLSRDGHAVVTLRERLQVRTVVILIDDRSDGSPPDETGALPDLREAGADDHGECCARFLEGVLIRRCLDVERFFLSPGGVEQIATVMHLSLRGAAGGSRSARIVPEVAYDEPHAGYRPDGKHHLQ
jgi:hypothetical protein